MLSPSVRSLNKLIQLVLLVQPPQLSEEVLTFSGVVRDAFVVMTVFVGVNSTSFFNDLPVRVEHLSIPDLVEHMPGRGV